MDIEIKTFFVKGYKNFSSNQWMEINNQSPLSLVIGKNNSGKTVFTELIEEVYSRREKSNVHILYSMALVKDLLRHGLSSVTVPDWSRTNRYLSPEEKEQYCQDLVGRKMTVEFCGQTVTDFSIVKDSSIGTDFSNGPYAQILTQTAMDIVLSFWKSLPQYAHFIRLAAERDIVKEKVVSSLDVASNGAGATNYVEHFLNDQSLPEEMIEQGVLQDLNQIMGEDGCFDRIQIKNVGQDKNDGSDEWEIALTERGSQKRYGLSEMGSGLKTIILMLIQLRQNYGKGDSIFYCFEELENNLHPAIQRRLFNFLLERSRDKYRKIFLTTHSNVALNLLAYQPGVSIYHVEKRNLISTSSLLSEKKELRDTMDDLGVQASDILQANGIIWVEGPSDKIYVEKWLHLAGCQKKEGIDYIYLYTNGKNLAQYTANEDIEKLTNFLLVNRNCCLVMDSDMKSESDELNQTKNRIINEFEKQSLFVWVTSGKEIENYLSLRVIKGMYPETKLTQVDKFSPFQNIINGDYPQFSSHKKEFASKATDLMTEVDLNVMDLKTNVLEIMKRIDKWNGAASGSKDSEEKKVN